MWWIRASIQEYILHSWSLVKMGTTAAQKKLFFNLRKMKNQIKAVEEGDLTPEHVTKIATELNVAEDDVVQMNRRLAAPDHSLNAPLRIDGEANGAGWSTDREPGDHAVGVAEFPRKKLPEKAPKRATAGAAHPDGAALEGRADHARGPSKNTTSAGSACGRSRSAPSSKYRRRSEIPLSSSG
jgi:hypothetical protein